jgi:hypothetical protein
MVNTIGKSTPFEKKLGVFINFLENYITRNLITCTEDMVDKVGVGRKYKNF